MPSPAPRPQGRGHDTAACSALLAGFSLDITGKSGELEPARVGYHRGAALRVPAREKPCAWASTVTLPARRSARE